MISEALLVERILHRRERSGDRKRDDQSMMYFRLWLRRAWVESEKGKELWRRHLESLEGARQ
jgi:hypothetical protein